jgi:hypothetical protein
MLQAPLMSDTLALRGYHVVYREHETNHCPGCGRVHWHIGRITAECAFCGTALPLEASHMQEPSAPFFMSRGKGGGKVQ